MVANKKNIKSVPIVPAPEPEKEVEPEPEPEKETPEEKVETEPEDDEEEEEEKPIVKEAPKPKKVVKKHDTKASEFETGYEKEEDGITYIVKEDKNGLKKWMQKKDKAEKKEKPKKATKEEKPKKEKEEKKKRAPTAYNRFVSKIMTELRLEQPGEPTTFYMRKAIDSWKALSAEEKEALKA